MQKRTSSIASERTTPTAADCFRGLDGSGAERGRLRDAGRRASDTTCAHLQLSSPRPGCSLAHSSRWWHRVWRNSRLCERRQRVLCNVLRPAPLRGNTGLQTGPPHRLGIAQSDPRVLVGEPARRGGKDPWARARARVEARDGGIRGRVAMTRCVLNARFTACRFWLTGRSRSRICGA